MLVKELQKWVEAEARGLTEELGFVWPAEWRVNLEQPPVREHGDYAANIALPLARLAGKPPRWLAGQLAARLEGVDSFRRLVRKVEVAGPGFLNLFLDWQEWANRLLSESGIVPNMKPGTGEESESDPKAKTESESDSKTESNSKAESNSKTESNSQSAAKPARATKVIVEHTSINPNKSAHIGHLRNAVIGDSIARMLRRTGCLVEVHNYIDDLGNQLADTVVGLLNEHSEERYERFGDYCWDIYARINRHYRSEPELTEERVKVLHALENGTGGLAWLGELVTDRIVREHVEEMRQFAIEYDVLVSERTLVREGLWDSAFELLRKTEGFAYETEGKLAGCWVLKAPGSASTCESAARAAGDVDVQAKGEVSAESEGQAANEGQEDALQSKVLVRSNGILTYTAKDIAYHLWKFGLLGEPFRYVRTASGVWATASAGASMPFGSAERVVNVIDQRQEYPQAVVKQALETLGFTRQAERLTHVGYGVVSLSPATAASLGLDVSDGKAAYAMSGRQGVGIKVSELLARMEQVIAEKRSRQAGLDSRTIAAAAVRYYLLKFALPTEIVFDMEQALATTGNTGIYLMYSHARAVSILRKDGNGEAIAVEQSSGSADRWQAITVPEMNPHEYALLRHAAHWPVVLEEAAAALAPHTICAYMFELTSLFNHFYAQCPILRAEEGVKPFRIWLTRLYQRTLAEGLHVVGLPAPEQM